jgi:ribosomal protein L37AE/L43A
METIREAKPRCKRCDSSFIYVRINGDIVCRSCGYINKKEDQKDDTNKL